MDEGEEEFAKDYYSKEIGDQLDHCAKHFKPSKNSQPMYFSPSRGPVPVPRKNKKTKIQSQIFHDNVKDWFEKKWEKEDEDTHLDDLLGEQP